MAARVERKRTLVVFNWARTPMGHFSLLQAADGSGTYETTMWAAGGEWHLRVRFVDEKKHETIMHKSKFDSASQCSAAAVRVLEECVAKREGPYAGSPDGGRRA